MQYRLGPLRPDQSSKHAAEQHPLYVLERLLQTREAQREDATEANEGPQVAGGLPKNLEGLAPLSKLRNFFIPFLQQGCKVLFPVNMLTNRLRYCCYY